MPYGQKTNTLNKSTIITNSVNTLKMVHIKKKKILKKKKEFLEDLSYRSKLGKLSSGHGTGKDQFSFQSLGKAMPKDAQTTAQLHSSHTLVK